MNPIPSPVADDGMVFVTSGFRGNSLKAIRLAGARGDIAGTPALAWSLDHDTPYVPSPLLYENTLYFLKTNSGVLSAYDAKTGKPYYRLQRLEGVPNVFASPVAARGRVYIPAATARRSSSSTARPTKFSPGTRSTTVRRLACARRPRDLPEGLHVSVRDRRT